MPTYCLYEGCKIQPFFNYENCTKGLYCFKHKQEGMINIMHQICTFPNCKIRPSFNYENCTKGLYCSEHKQKDMINVITKTCAFLDCKTHPIFNYENCKTPLYCSKHKQDGMINIKNKTCAFPNCKTIPTFNYEGKKALYCSEHKQKDMINVKSKTCTFPNCKTQPIFNYENCKTPLYCSKHKQDGMINIKDKTCAFPNCKTLPTFNYENCKKTLYCSKHKQEGMINIKDKLCKTPLCYTLASKKYDGYCLNCFMHLFPDKPVSRNYKTKEIYVRDYILDKFKNFTWVCDKKVENGCSLRRPDLLLDLGYQIIVIEIDENQHIDYDCSCENKRLMEISQDINHRPLIFIRFNPDDYKKDGKKITSCWGINGKGICTVKKSKKVEWKNRLESLSETIEYWVDIENKTAKTVEVIELFYDD